MKKTALITGAGSGIGQGVACALAEQGYHIIVTDLSLGAAEKTVAMIVPPGGSAQALAINVAEQSSIDQAFAQLEGQRIDLLVNNAGLQHVCPLDEFPPEKFNLLLQVMLNGAAMMARACLPIMRAQGYGRIVNIGSIHSLVASPFKSAYVAAKHGLVGFSKVVALETADTDITINTVCPAYVKTPLVEKQIADQAASHGISEEQVINEIMLKPMPKKSFISVEELAATVSFLASDMARNITAQTITLDGGWTAQ
ncbi:MAG: 3-hydroxybutyrate dehydrogenase [Marinobacterium sp.]|nr:3-hydroxybutyrate dehydrogenase [Marinobacterium sp.]